MESYASYCPCDILPPPTLMLRGGGFLGSTSYCWYIYQAIPVCPTVPVKTIDIHPTPRACQFKPSTQPPFSTQSFKKNKKSPGYKPGHIPIDQTHSPSTILFTIRFPMTTANTQKSNTMMPPVVVNKGAVYSGDNTLATPIRMNGRKLNSVAVVLTCAVTADTYFLSDSLSLTTSAR